MARWKGHVRWVCLWKGLLGGMERRVDERLDFTFRCVRIKIADDQGRKVGPASHRDTLRCPLLGCADKLETGFNEFI